MMQSTFNLLKGLLFCLLVALLQIGSVTASTLQPNADGTVTDPKTGLTWMRCAMGQTWTGSTCSGTARTYTFDQANALGTLAFAGQSDWRMPNIRELQTIVDRSVSNPAIDSAAFPNTPSSITVGSSTQSSYFWSSSLHSVNGSAAPAWFIAFSEGVVGINPGSYYYAVRLVRGGQSFGSLLSITRPTSDYVDHGNGTVTHTPTNLTWKRCAEGKTWTGSTCTGTASIYTFDQANALTGTTTFAGQSDWRMPTADELLSLADYGASGAINASIFPAAPNSYVWSGSPHASSWSDAWFFGGGIYFDSRGKSFAVRLVRGGQSASNPAPVCTLSANPATINAGTSATLTATCTPAATSYTWTGGTCAGTTGATCTVTPTATTTYTVAGTNAGGTGAAASATVTVNATCASGSSFAFSLCDEFSGTSVNTAVWKQISNVNENTGNSSSVHDGYLDLGQNTTDFGGAVVTRFAPQKHLRVTLLHNMHSGGSYFYPVVYFESAVGKWLVSLTWMRTDWAPSNCNQSSRYDRVDLSINAGGSCESDNVLSSVASSSFYDRWSTAVLDYDMETGLVTADLENDGTVDLQATVPIAARLPVTGVGMSANGWWTGHWHRVDSIKIEGTPQGASATHALNVNVAGNGGGVVTGSGINCTSGTCSTAVVSGTAVTLTATPTTGSTFAGWSGACTGTGSCTVSMTEAKSVTATFALSVTPPVCTLSANPATINAGASATLTATCTPAASSYTWTGGTCAGTTGATCTVTPTATTTYTVAGANTGGAGTAASATVTIASASAPVCTLSANPASITAGGSSTLTATCNPPATGYIWTGGTCAGTTGATCTVKPTATTTYSVQGSNAGGANQAASATITVKASTASYTVPGTLGNDVFVLTAGNSYYGGAGNDTFIISTNTLRGGVTAKIIDTEGDNTIQLVDGLTLTASTFYADAAQLTLSNGAVVQILGASKFKYQVGANLLAGDTADVLTYSQFVSSLGASLSGTLPASGTAGYVVPTVFTQTSAPVPSVAGSSYTVPGTSDDDVLVPAGGNSYLGGGGNDTYIISPYTLSGAVTAKIIDSEGANVIQLVKGLTIASSSFFNNAVQLMLSNGAIVQILGASGFSYQLGANAPAGVTASSLSYAQFAAALGASVPAAGAAAVSGSANFVVPGSSQ